MPYELNLQKALTDGVYRWEKSPDGAFCALEGVVYCAKPEPNATFRVRETRYYGVEGKPLSEEELNRVGGIIQSLNVYAPAAYFEGGSVNGWTRETAPIVFNNYCSGWRSSAPHGPEREMDFLNAGFVVVNCGARSRGAGISDDGRDLGKMPCMIVDLLAGVRFVRANRGALPGNTDRMVSRGTSGGGQASSILGAAGNLPEYLPYLYEIGAVGVGKNGDEYVSTVRDDIFGCQCYCAIADIENADLAYAWAHFDAGETGMPDKNEAGEEYFRPFTPFQLALQEDLAYAFAAYINTLGLQNDAGEPLTFDPGPDGRPDPRKGSYYRQTLQILTDSLNTFLRDAAAAGQYVQRRFLGESETVPFADAETYLADFAEMENWLRREADGSYTVTSLAGYIRNATLVRNKDIPGYDTFFNKIESDAFGLPDERVSHFSAAVAAVLKANYDRYSKLEGFADCDVDDYLEKAVRPYVKRQAALINGTHILLSGRSDPAAHWRVRNGSTDAHTSVPIAYDLAMAARHNPKVRSVDYALCWSQLHGDVEGTASTGTFVGWVERICREA